MTKADLEQLRSLKVEIKTLSEEIAKAEQSMVMDVVIGSRHEIPYDQKIIVITGLDQGKSMRLREKLSAACRQLQILLEETEEWIESLPDPEMRVILRLYYRNGLTQREIGKELGYDQSVVSRKLNEFMRINFY